MCRSAFYSHCYLPNFYHNWNKTLRAKILCIKFQEHLFSESAVVTYKWTHTVQLTGTYLHLFDTNMPQKQIYHDFSTLMYASDSTSWSQQLSEECRLVISFLISKVQFVAIIHIYLANSFRNDLSFKNNVL